MSFRADRRSVRLFRLLTGLGVGLMGAVVGVAAWQLWLPLLWLLLPVGLCGAWIVWWYAVHWAAGYDGAMKTERLCFRRGVFWRREWILPLSALRGVEQWEPPLHRLCGCRTLLLRHTGGTVLLPLLPREQAAALWQRLEALS